MVANLTEQLIWLIVLAIPVASVTWTVIHEDIFREPRDWLTRCSEEAPRWWQRKFCYVFMCEYCFSHYVAAGAVTLVGYKLLLPDWRGYLLAWLAVVAIANVYMSAYSRLRVEIKKGRAEAHETENRARRAG